MTENRTLAGRRTGLPAVELAIVAGFLLLFGGLTLPFVEVQRFFIFTEAFSLLEAMRTLVEEGEVLLAGVVLLFSVLFPLLKLGIAVQIWWLTEVGDAGFRVRLHRLEVLGKWSMLDVFVAALVIFSVKMSAVADATTRPGLYCFLAAVVLSMAVIQRIKRVAEEAGRPPSA